MPDSARADAPSGLPANQRAVRFWIQYAAQRVRVTVRPDEQLHVYEHRSTDEGWRAISTTFEIDGEWVEMYRREVEIDCDGRSERRSQHATPLSALREISGLDPQLPAWLLSTTRIDDLSACEANF